MNDLVNLFDYQARARQVLKTEAYDYIAGGAGGGASLDRPRGILGVILRPPARHRAQPDRSAPGGGRCCRQPSGGVRRRRLPRHRRAEGHSQWAPGLSGSPGDPARLATYAAKLGVLLAAVEQSRKPAVTGHDGWATTRMLILHHCGLSLVQIDHEKVIAGGSYRLTLPPWAEVIQAASRPPRGATWQGRGGRAGRCRRAAAGHRRIRAGSG